MCALKCIAGQHAFESSINRNFLAFARSFDEALVKEVVTTSVKNAYIILYLRDHSELYWIDCRWWHPTFWQEPSFYVPSFHLNAAWFVSYIRVTFRMHWCGAREGIIIMRLHEWDRVLTRTKLGRTIHLIIYVSYFDNFFSKKGCPAGFSIYFMNVYAKKKRANLTKLNHSSRTQSCTIQWVRRNGYTVCFSYSFMWLCWSTFPTSQKADSVYTFSSSDWMLILL